jgi:hypothetical protein
MRTKAIIGTSLGVLIFAALISADPEIQSLEQAEKPAVKAEPATTSDPTLRPGYGICDTKQNFDHFVDAVGRQDARMLAMLEKQGYCTLTTAGLRFSLLDRSIGGTAKVRIWIGDDGRHFDAYTYNEATRGNK